jgi:putative ABC transport system substrate-binding protein
MKNITGFLKGITFILVVGGILLLSDWSNREKAGKSGNLFNKKKKEQTSAVGEGKPLFNPPVKIAIVHYVLSPDCEDVTTGILQRFTELGHIKNGDFTFDQYVANADAATLNDIVRVVSEKKYDLIFSTVLMTTQALSSKINDVPILFTIVADPVGNGLGKSYADHKSNITGIDGMSYTDQGIQLIKKYIPHIRNLGTLFCPGEMASRSCLRELTKSCNINNIRLISVPVNSVSEVTDATMMLCMKDIDAICQIQDNCTIPGFSSMVKVTRREKVPLFCFISSQVKMGAIAAVAGDYLQQGKEIGDLAIEVINGKSPAEIPFTRLKYIRTVINPQAAIAYGLKTPEELFKSANQIIGD